MNLRPFKDLKTELAVKDECEEMIRSLILKHPVLRLALMTAEYDKVRLPLEDLERVGSDLAFMLMGSTAALKAYRDKVWAEDTADTPLIS